MTRVIGSNQDIEIGGIKFYIQTTGGNLKKGQVLYSMQDHFTYTGIRKIVLPGIRTMKRLTKKFLDCEYHETYRRGETLEFVIDSGIQLENRAAFFAAVCAHTKITNES